MLLIQRQYNKNDKSLSSGIFWGYTLGSYLALSLIILLSIKF